MALDGARQAAASPPIAFQRFTRSPTTTGKKSHANARRAREGEKRHYDRITVPLIRNWRKVQPDLAGPQAITMCSTSLPECRISPAKAFAPCGPGFPIGSMSQAGSRPAGTFDSALRDTIELALRHGIDAIGGVPKSLYFDNGKDYQAFSGAGVPATTMSRLPTCAAFAIKPIFALPHNPRAKLNERNYRILERFEQQWFSYCGRNNHHLEKLWDVKREDGFSLRQRLERYPKNHPLAGCLVRPELLPDLDQIRAAFGNGSPPNVTRWSAAGASALGNRRSSAIRPRPSRSYCASSPPTKSLMLSCASTASRSR